MPLSTAEQQQQRNRDEDLRVAARCFALFTPSEQRRALTEFAVLRYPHVEERFMEAVHRVIRDDKKRSAEAPCP